MMFLKRVGRFPRGRMRYNEDNTEVQAAMGRVEKTHKRETIDLETMFIRVRWNDKECRVEVLHYGLASKWIR